MSFREKSAWITFVSLLVVGGFYFSQVATNGAGIHVLLGSVLALVVLEIVSHVVIAARAPNDARAPKDEREQLIELKSIRNAFYVFAVGALSSITGVHLHFDRTMIVQHVLLAFVVAELVQYGSQIVLFRRGR